MKKSLLIYLLLSLPLVAVVAQEPTTCYGVEGMPTQWQSDTLFQTRLSDNDRWWRELDDVLLDSLVQVALSNNQNLLAATQRIAIAQHQLYEARGAYSPSFTLDGGWNRAQTSTHTERSPIPMEITDYTYLQLSTSWEIDVFGSIRNSVKAKKGAYRASKEAYSAVMLSLCAEVASGYGQLRTLQQSRKVVEQNIEVQHSILQIVQARYESGLVAKLDVAQAQTAYYGTLATLPTLQIAIDQQIATLSTLLGLYPASLRGALERDSGLPNYWQIVGVGIPADLIRRRPDIREAEERVATYAATLGAARSDLLPKFYITGDFGFAAHELKQLFQHNSIAYEIAPTFSWTLFQGTQKRQAQSAAKAALEQEVLLYNQTLLTAVQEVDVAMSSYMGAIQEIGAWQEATTYGEESLQQAVELYKQGLGTFNSVLESQQSLESIQRSLVTAQGSALTALVQLYKSLGGGLH